ncbi:Na+/H+ antiporter subunit E [Nocardiopsis coralliicola]
MTDQISRDAAANAAAAPPAPAGARRLRRIGRALAFPAYYAWQVLASSAAVAADVCTPGSRAAPAFVEVPSRCQTPLELTAFANMVSLTPGTVTVATRSAPATLWVHGLYVTDRAAFLAELSAMEDRLLGATRTGGAPAGPPAAPAAEGPSAAAPGEEDR